MSPDDRLDLYDPQVPVRPDTFAGRERLLRATNEYLETAAESHRGTSILLHGYRGSGKISPLRKIEALARERLPETLRVGAGWLERESLDLSEEDVRAFAKIAAGGKMTYRTSEILGLGIRNVYIDRLIREGILRKVSRGRHELRRAPAIAYYHALRQGISW